MYIAAGQGQTTPGTKFWCQQEPLVTSIICYKFQKNLFEVWFYTIFFMVLYMYIAPGQGLTTPWGWNFDVNRNILSLQSFVASLKKNLFEVLQSDWSDQGLYCLPFCVHLLDALLYGKATLLKFKGDYSIFFGCPKTVLNFSLTPCNNSFQPLLKHRSGGPIFVFWQYTVRNIWKM